jgi:hypothetical protein
VSAFGLGGYVVSAAFRKVLAGLELASRWIPPPPARPLGSRPALGRRTPPTSATASSSAADAPTGPLWGPALGESASACRSWCSVFWATPPRRELRARCNAVPLLVFGLLGDASAARTAGSVQRRATNQRQLRNNFVALRRRACDIQSCGLTFRRSVKEVPRRRWSAPGPAQDATLLCSRTVPRARNP